MAIYHFELTPVKSTVAKVFDYVSREGNYRDKKGELTLSVSGNMPSWADDNPRSFWSAADKHERANARVAVMFDAALPIEASPDEQISLAMKLLKSVTTTKDGSLPYTMAIHAHEKNPHVHIVISERPDDGISRSREQFFRRGNKKSLADGGAMKSLAWKPKERLIQERQSWENIINEFLIEKGHEKVSCKSLKDQGIDRPAQIHLSRRSAGLEKRGIKTKEGEHWRAYNEKVKELMVATVKLKEEVTHKKQYTPQVEAFMRKAAEEKAKHDEIKKLQTKRKTAWQEKNWEEAERITEEIKALNKSRSKSAIKASTVAATKPLPSTTERAGVSPAEKPDTPPPAWLQAAQAFEAAQDNRAQGEAALTAFALELKKLQKEYDEQAQAAKNLEDKIFWTERNLGSARHALAEAPGKKYLDAQAAHTEREAKEARAAEQQECELLPPKYKKMAEAGALPEVPEKWGLFELAGTKKSVQDYISSKKRAERAEEAAARARNQKETRWNEREEQAEKVTTLEQELTRMKAGLRTEQATAVRLEQKVKTGKEDLKKYQARADQQWPDRVREREEEKKRARQRSQGMGR